MAATWTSATVTNPSANAVIIDTGAFGNGLARFFQVIINSTLAGTFLFQLVDVDGSTVLQQQEIGVVAGDTKEMPMVYMAVVTGQRVRVLSNALILSRVSCSMMWGSSWGLT